MPLALSPSPLHPSPPTPPPLQPHLHEPPWPHRLHGVDRRLLLRILPLLLLAGRWGPCTTLTVGGTAAAAAATAVPCTGGGCLAKAAAWL